MTKKMKTAAMFVSLVSMFAVASLYGHPNNPPVAMFTEGRDGQDGRRGYGYEKHPYLWSFWGGLLTFSSSYEVFEEKSAINYSIGQDLLFGHRIVWGSYESMAYHYVGLTYKWGGSGKSADCHWIFIPVDYNWPLQSALGAGMTLSYNYDMSISKKYFRVKYFSAVPQISFLIGTDFPVQLIVNYRYNINFGFGNSNEFELKVGVLDIVKEGRK